MRISRRPTEHELDIGHREFRSCLDEGVQSAWHHCRRSAAEQVSADHAERHAVKAHLTVERAGARPCVSYVGAEMVLEVATYRQVGGDTDAVTLQMLGGADARKHQNLRRIKGAGCKDDFARGFGTYRRTVVDIFDAFSVRAVENNPCRLCVYRDRKVLSSARRLEESIGG